VFSRRRRGLETTPGGGETFASQIFDSDGGQPATFGTAEPATSGDLGTESVAVTMPSESGGTASFESEWTRTTAVGHRNASGQTARSSGELWLDRQGDAPTVDLLQSVTTLEA